MVCPECSKELMVEISDYELGTDRQDVSFVCENNHRFFVRVKQDDLIEEDI